MIVGSFRRDTETHYNSCNVSPRGLGSTTRDIQKDVESHMPRRKQLVTRLQPLNSTRRGLTRDLQAEGGTLEANLIINSQMVTSALPISQRYSHRCWSCYDVSFEMSFVIPTICTSCDSLPLPHEAGMVLEESTSDAGKRGDPPLLALPYGCGETRAKLLASAEFVVLESLGTSTLDWSMRARHTSSL